MNPLVQTKLISLMNTTTGHPDIIIGIIDGPVDLSHPAFQGAMIRTVKDSQAIECKNANDIACGHGTFITGILCARRGLPVSGICPNCKIILNPIFTKEVTNSKINNGTTLPSATPDELATAIIETIDAGAKIINLSLGLSTSSLRVYDKLQYAYNYAVQKGVIIVVAAGNQGNIGNISLIKHQWLIPVAACNENGILDPMSNFGPSIGTRGLMAPGVNITSTSSTGGYTMSSGTSVAAPFVTGTLALLWSIFPKKTASNLKFSISKQNKRSIMPSILDAYSAFLILKNEPHL
jgi:subtilisin family serine protease